LKDSKFYNILFIYFFEKNFFYLLSKFEKH